MTLAERLEQRGRQEGILEGLQKAAIIFKRFSDGASIQEMAKETGLSISEIETLIKASY